MGSGSDHSPISNQDLFFLETENLQVKFLLQQIESSLKYLNTVHNATSYYVPVSFLILRGKVRSRILSSFIYHGRNFDHCTDRFAQNQYSFIRIKRSKLMRVGGFSRWNWVIFPDEIIRPKEKSKSISSSRGAYLGFFLPP